MQQFVQSDDFRRLNVGFALDEGTFVSVSTSAEKHAL